jgi:hypothetical protein
LVAGGHPEIVLYLSVNLAAYGVARTLAEAIRSRRRPAEESFWRRRLAPLAVAGMLSFGLSAIVLWPAYELLHNSVDVLRHPLYGPGMVPRDLLRQLDRMARRSSRRACPVRV